LAKSGHNPVSEYQKRRKPTVSVIIPTYKRGHLLKHVLEALTNQTSDDFEVLVVLKPSGDGTEELIELYSEKLKTKLIIQSHGYFLDALNLGISNAEGEIIVFLDDDAIPFPNLIQSYIISYKSPEIGGVAGEVIPVMLNGDEVCQFKDTASELIPDKNQCPETALARKLGSRPLKGLENYMLYLSKAGYVSINYEITHRAMHSQTVNSLLGKGANMSISSKASAGFQFPTSGVFGLTGEQYLGWYLWRKGYRVVFNPQIKVYHIHHGQSLSRNIKDAKKEAVLYTEARLLFYRLYGSEPELSMMHRVVLLLLETFIDIKAICLCKETCRVSRFTNKFRAELLGLRWLLYKKVGSSYSPLVDLEKMLR
jgi:glycosyltransferase involved in cell wall biosynthesis